MHRHLHAKKLCCFDNCACHWNCTVGMMLWVAMYYVLSHSCNLNQNWNGSESDLITGLFRPAVQYQSDVLGTSKIRVCLMEFGLMKSMMLFQYYGHRKC